MIFLIESVLLCAAFTAIVVTSVKKDPLAWVDDYPPAIGDRVRELGLVEDRGRPGLKDLLKEKLGRCLLVIVVLTLVVFFVNGADGFLSGFTVSYGLWFVIAWYDALVLDCIWACHSEKVRIPGTEDMADEYRDYWFHIRMSILGCVLGLPLCIAVGALTELLNILL